jgi:hypothetical protein
MHNSTGLLTSLFLFTSDYLTKPSSTRNKGVPLQEPKKTISSEKHHYASGEKKKKKTQEAFYSVNFPR